MTRNEYQHRMREYDQLIGDAERRVSHSSPVLRALREQRGCLLTTYAGEQQPLL